MHDLNTISRLNAQAFAPAIEHLRKQGRTVVAKYDGLTLMSIESFSDPTEAARACTQPSAIGQRLQLFHAYPTEPVQTLADYVGHVRAREGIVVGAADSNGGPTD